MKITQFDNKPITTVNIEESSPIDDLVTEAQDQPAVGKTIRTNGHNNMEGKIESIERSKDGIFVLFRIPDGRLMQTPIGNVTVVEELSDEDTELMELTNDMLTRYKTAAAADAREADKKGNIARGNKRFSGVVKATIKQFDNDAKKVPTKEGGLGGINRVDHLGLSYEKVLDEVTDLWNKEKQDTDEALDPWHGYTPDDKKANALAKSPKTSMQGSRDVPFDQMVKDTIKTHGLKWAFDYYVRKHGLPPRQFQVFAGLTVKPKDLKQTTPDKAPEPLGAVRNPIKPEKQGWWKRLRGKLPFEE